MRKVLAFPLFSLGLASLVCGAQRGSMAPSVAAPAMRAMPTASTGAVPAVPAHGAAPAYGAPVHTRTQAGAPDAHAVTTHKTTGAPTQHQPSNSGGDGKFHAFYPYSTNLLPGIRDNFAGDTEATPQAEEEEVNADEPQPVSHQEVMAEEPVAPSRARSGSYVSSGPVPEFVFVKHDGSTFSAAAYTWMKDKLQYVTKNALRYETGIETLDLPATERMNEERGNTMNFPKSLVSSVAE